MQEFWATTTVHHHAIRFMMDNKKHIVNLESFRDMLHICPRVHGQSFAEPPFEEEILALIHFLRHSAAIRTLTDVNINKLYQPWRSFAAIINKSNTKTLRRAMRCIILDSRRLSSIISCQRIRPFQGGTRNSNAYNEYYAIATGAAPPKPKASVRRTRSSSDTSITPPTAAASPRLTASAKGKQTAKASKAKSLSALSEVAMTEAQQLKLLTKRSMQQEELSWNSTDDEGADDEGRDGDDKDEEDEGDNGEEGDSDNDDENDDGEEGDNDDADQEVERDDDKDDEEEGGDDDQEFDKEEYAEETRDEESFDPILRTPKNSDDEGNAQRDNDEFLKTVDENMQKIIKEQVKEQVKVQVSKILPRIKQAVNEQLKAEVLTRSSHSSKTSYAISADLLKMELKKILIEKIEGSKSVQRSDEQRNHYKAFVEAYESDKIILDTYGETVTLKRRRDDDADKDEEPSAGPDRGSKRRREGNEPESASALTKTATRSAGRSIQGFRSRQASTRESALTEEPMQTTSQMEEPSYPEFDTGQQYPHNLLKPLPLIPNNRGRRVIPFEYFINNDLEYLRGGASSRKYTTSITKMKAADYGHIKWIEDLVPRTIWIEEPIGYDKHALWGRRIIAVTELKIVEWHSYKHLDWITVRRDDDKLYKFKEGNFKRLRIQDIEDMLLLLVQGKLTNLTVEECFAFNRRVEDLQLGVESYQKKLNLTKPDSYRYDLKCKEAYTAYSNPRGFIYQNKEKRNRLIRIDELHKFSDGTLTDVRTALDDRLKGIRMQYLPQSIWRRSDKDKAAAMIQDIDKRLKTRRIMRSLERFVGGRLSILTDLQVTPTKPRRMTKPYSSHRFIANCFNAGNLKMELKSAIFHCEVKIDKIRTKNGWNFPSYGRGEMYRLELEIFDDTAKAVVVMFDETAKSLLKCSTSAMVAW
nr:hypothetical protein [Tanacetum cinerariifolium]